MRDGILEIGDVLTAEGDNDKDCVTIILALTDTFVVLLTYDPNNGSAIHHWNGYVPRLETWHAFGWKLL